MEFVHWPNQGEYSRNARLHEERMAAPVMMIYLFGAAVFNGLVTSVEQIGFRELERNVGRGTQEEARATGCVIDKPPK